MSTKNKGLYEIESRVNAHLSSLPADRRPEASNRRRIQSIAVAARGFEATDLNGSTEGITVEQALGYLDAK